MRKGRSRRYLMLISGVALAAGSATTASAATPASIAGIGELRGVYCTSASNCLAVGDVFVKAADLNQLLHWNGKTWSKVAVPSPGGTHTDDFSELHAVRCTTPDNCWAVGEYLHGAQLNQILRWNGKKWRVAAGIPEPGGEINGEFSELEDVACTSAKNCWAVGQFGKDSATGEVILNQALRWNGKTWSHVPTPNPAGTATNDENDLVGIRCATVNDCWAVGAYGNEQNGGRLFNEVLHWTGKKWTKVTVPNPGGTAIRDFSTLVSVSCTSTADCKAVGSYGSNAIGGARLNEVLSWNGTKWSVPKIPNPDGTAAGDAQNLTGISCLSPHSCWTACHSGTQTQPTGTLNEAFRWNGKKWSQVTTPDPGGMTMHGVSQFFAIRCVTSADCWAVGNQVNGGGAFHDMILHWNGTKWIVK
ncbi:MAG TPA: hypothetical protein VFI65_01260 [Streptosporangiaceae bacterium]|nr:hypothetical protein [Streptosporangiaceae bacterium]